MNRLNEEAVVRALFPFGQQHVDKLRDRIEIEAMQFDFEPRTHDRASLLSTFDLWLKKNLLSPFSTINFLLNLRTYIKIHINYGSY